jgi:hypothetical protein
LPDPPTGFKLRGGVTINKDRVRNRGETPHNGLNKDIRKAHIVKGGFNEVSF